MTRISKRHKYEILINAIQRRVKLLDYISPFVSGPQRISFIAEKNCLRNIEQDLNLRTCDGIYFKLQTLFDICRTWEQKSNEIINGGVNDNPSKFGQYCAYKFVIDLYDCMPEYWPN